MEKLNDDEILEKVISFEAIFESMMKCKKGVIWKDSAASFHLNGIEQSLKLSRELHDGTYKGRPPKKFMITSPKPREAVSIAFRDRVYQRSMNDNVVSEADRIHQAIAEDSQISFRYFHYTPDRANSKNYSYDGNRVTVSPYALLWNNGNYYLYAYDGKKFRYYRVDRMERISFPLLQKREGKELFKEKNIISQKAKVFDMYGGKEYNVRIRFRKELADAVIDQFGKDVMMVPVDEDHFTITVPVEVSPTFFAWISTFGRRVKILGPAPVVEKMREFIHRVADMYQDE